MNRTTRRSKRRLNNNFLL